MNTLLKGFAIAGLLASAATSAIAQHHDNQRPQANQGGRQGKYREATVSHGHKFRKGQRIAPNQRRYVVNDWNQRGLRAPPRGYQWVREDNNSGDYLLVAAATGLIASILAQQ